ncbi:MULTISPECIES: YacL family protein [Basfia]|nr:MULTISPECIES: YacL family protein [Basfia]
MDFQFTRYLGSVEAKCSMGHEAVANWFNSEVRSDSQKIYTALSVLAQAKKQSYEQEIRLIGAEYSLFINADEVMVKANNLDMTDGSEQDLEEDFHYYDEESIAFCGLEDFENFLTSYLNFIA